MSAREHTKNTDFFKPLGTILRFLSKYRFRETSYLQFKVALHFTDLIRSSWENLLTSDWLKVYLAQTQELTGALFSVQASRTITDRIELHSVLLPLLSLSADHSRQLLGRPSSYYEILTTCTCNNQKNENQTQIMAKQVSARLARKNVFYAFY